MISEYLNDILDSEFDGITISLDTADKEEYYKITGLDAFDKVINNICLLRDHRINVNINAVVSSFNILSIENLIGLATDLKVNIKLIDYVKFNRDDAFNSSLSYVNFDSIYSYMDLMSSECKIVYPYDGMGTPMKEYTMKNGTKILVKDARLGTYYNRDCQQCRNYPCQDALISVRMTADGKLKKCLIRNDNLIDFIDDIKFGDLASAKEKFKQLFDDMTSASYMSGAWGCNELAKI